MKAVTYLPFPRCSKHVCVSGYLLKDRDTYHVQLIHYIAFN